MVRYPRLCLQQSRLAGSSENPLSCGVAVVVVTTARQKVRNDVNSKKGRRGYFFCDETYYTRDLGFKRVRSMVTSS